MEFSNKSKILSKDEINKLGNAIIYIANKIPDLSKTKLLKLIYLIDELSVRKIGIPFFNLTYKVWQAGPVNVELYSNLSNGKGVLTDTFFEVTEDKYQIIKPLRDFSDDEFSNKDIELLDLIVATYGKKNASELVNICHKKDTLWYRIAQENGILEAFENGTLNTSDYVIDLSDYLEDCKLKNLNLDYNEFLRFGRLYK